jgi:3-phosphoshikimate 1-carboxyvinyltransferase
MALNNNWRFSKLIEQEDSQALMGCLDMPKQHVSILTICWPKTFDGENKVTQQFTILPGKKTFTGKFTVPGDKSVSHRSIMFGAIAEGTTHVTGFLKVKMLWQLCRLSVIWA